MNKRNCLVFAAGLILLAGVCVAGLLPKAIFTAKAPDVNCLVVVVDPLASPFPIDQAKIVGILLKPAEARAGKWNYSIGACDPEGDPFFVELTQGPVGFTLAADNTAGKLVLSGDLPRGVTYFYLRAVDTPGTVTDPCEQTYTLAVNATKRPNKWPILRWLF